MLADGLRAALVGPRGDLVWMCAPEWDSDAVFSALIGGGGSYGVWPSEPWVLGSGYYEEGTLIWRSRWVTGGGIVECREALAMPGDPHRAVVLRRVVTFDSPVTIAVRLDPRAEFGRFGMRDVRERDDRLEARSGPLRLRWLGTDVRQERGGGAFVGEIELGAGESRDLVLEISDRPLPEPIDPDVAWDETESRWARVAPRCEDTAARRDARHAYAVLRGLTRPGGGLVAAATTSLPGRAPSGRSFDHRYAWIRDQCFAGIAIAGHGEHELVSEAAGFVTSRLLDDGPGLKPAYCADGRAVPEERQLEHLRGYPGGCGTVGNLVNRQMQLDAFGESLLLLSAAHRAGVLSGDGRRAIDVAAGAIGQLFDTPDAGIWELDPDWWTHSRLECVAGLRALAECGVADSSLSARWQSLADALLAETAKRCLHPSGRWQRSPTDTRVDAALLIPTVRGAVAPHDPRSVTTLEAVLAELGEEGFCYRFRHDDRPLDEAEGVFVPGGFIVSLALLDRGDRERAARFFEQNRSACGPPGLLSEEYDVVQRQLRGNLPRAFVHALMLECAVRLGPEARLPESRT